MVTNAEDDDGFEEALLDQEKITYPMFSGQHSFVVGLANLRNRLGDAHGQGKRPVNNFHATLNWQATWPEAWHRFLWQRLKRRTMKLEST